MLRTAKIRSLLRPTQYAYRVMDLIGRAQRCYLEDGRFSQLLVRILSLLLEKTADS